MDELESAAVALGFVGQVLRLPVADARRVRAELLSAFVHGGDRRFWWEAFSKPAAEVSFPEGARPRRVLDLVPSPEEPCWLLVEDLESDEYSVYEATPAVAVRVLGEFIGLEYYLVAKDRRWLVCESHHHVVIGVGPEVVEAINRVSR